MPKKSDLTENLLIACRDGDVNAVNRLIHDNVSLDERYSESKMSIMQATLLTYNLAPEPLRLNKAAIFRLLLAHAPEQLNYQNSDGETVAHFMAISGYNDLIKELLPTHLRLFMIPSAQVKYPIFFAILSHQYETVELLLDADREFCNLKDAREQNILHYAVQGMDIKMLDICLSFCPKLIDAPNANNETPINLAIKMNADQNFIQLLESANINKHCASVKTR